jgi:hypothetical protein
MDSSPFTLSLSKGLFQYCSHRNPFTLSLSKGRERERLRQAQPERQCEQSWGLFAEGPNGSCAEGFDRLSPNGTRLSPNGTRLSPNGTWLSPNGSLP